MARAGWRAVTAALLGALVGAASLALAVALRPDVTFEMDRDLPRIASGFYPVERHETETFAWTGARAEIRLAGLDRRSPWECVVRLRGGRPPSLAPPEVHLAVDGMILTNRVVAGDYEDLHVTIPAHPSRLGAILTIASSPTFVPSPADRRELGVQVDRLDCSPAGLALPSRQALTQAGIAGGALGAALALTSAARGAALAATVLLGGWQALLFSSGMAPYTPYLERAVRVAIWMAIAMVLVVWIFDRGLHRPLQAEARFVVAFSGAALYLKLLALLHPSKALIDALFHAHRLEWVLAGRFYFTQPMPDGVQFPYAIALYLFAAPWSALTGDHVALLRIVVSAVEAVAGALLYVVIVRTWGDRRVGALAVVLFHLVPLPYGLIGNANLTNAFGQSAALITLVAATALPLGPRSFGQLGGLSLLAAVAFLSHVGTFALLLVTLVALGVFFRWLGSHSLRAPARLVVLAATIAAVASVVSYYGHFGEVYERLGRVRGQARTVAPVASPASGSGSSDAAPSMPLHRRALGAVAYSVRHLGWPILVLASLGAARIWTEGGRDRLVLLLAAWGVTYVIFVLFGSLVRVGPQFERYAAEFIGRVDYAVYPAVVILAARGAVWAWRAGPVPRVASAVFMLLAFAEGVRSWAGWLD